MAAASNTLMPGPVVSSSGSISLDWSLLARPQADGYDTRVFLQMAGILPTVTADSPSCFSGAVRLLSSLPHSNLMPDFCVPAPTDHPNIETACQLVGLWPDAFSQCQAVFDSFTPLLDIRTATAEAGSVSSSYKFRSVAATVNQPSWLAGALLRELAYHKLCILEGGHSRADRIIQNSGDQTWQLDPESAPQSLTAIFGSYYAVLHVATLDIAIWKDGNLPAVIDVSERRLTQSLPRLKSARNLLKEYAKADPHGTNFLRGCEEWLDSLLVAYRGATSEAPTGDPGNRESRLRPRRVPGIMESSVLDELLLYVPHRDLAVSLNESARAVLELCDGRSSIAEIAFKIGQDLDVLESEESVALMAGVMSAVRQLRTLGVLSSHDESI